MKRIPDNSIDLVLTDPPYWTTACKWDSVIDFDLMWKELKRIIKSNGAIVLFWSEPFSSALRMSNIKQYKHDWIWEKDAGSNFQTVKYQPMKEHEIISVFWEWKINYFPIMQERIGSRKWKETTTIDSGRTNSVYWTMEWGKRLFVPELRNPRSIQRFNRERWIHPTQKPVALLEYLIRTYTNEWEMVLDFTAWSGTTGVACKNTNRNYILIEKDPEYCEIIKKRLSNTNSPLF